ncbi:MAG: lmo0937 family membrane protein [Pyrinomonadaceae bacterium]
MLETIIVILLVLWLIGFIAAPASIGNLIHILLVIALAVFVIRLVTGRRVV